MQLNLLDMLPNLLRRRQGGAGEDQEQQPEVPGEEQFNEAATLEEFWHLKWTRIVSLQGWESNSTRALDLGPDVVAVLQRM